MADLRLITAEGVARVSLEFHGIRLGAVESAAVAGLLNALEIDMQALHAFEVGEAEPVVMYHAAEGDA